VSVSFKRCAAQSPPCQLCCSNCLGEFKVRALEELGKEAELHNYYKRYASPLIA
jgi:hypothetical protein